MHRHTYTHQKERERERKKNFTKRISQKWKRNSYSPKNNKKKKKKNPKSENEWNGNIAELYECSKFWWYVCISFKPFTDADTLSINTCNSFFMRILLLYILYAGVRFFFLRYYYNFMLVYFLSVVFFVHSQCLFHLLFMCLIFFRRLFARNVFLKLFFSLKRRSYLVFVIVFNQKKKSHFPSYMTFAIHSRSRSRHTGK